jgi:hypothetical protein
MPALSWPINPSSLAMNCYSPLSLESLLQLPTPDNTSSPCSNTIEAPLDTIEHFFRFLPPDNELGGVATAGATMEDRYGCFGAEGKSDQHCNAVDNTIGSLHDDTDTPGQIQHDLGAGEAVVSDAVLLGGHDALISLSRLNVSVSQQLAKFDSYPWHDAPLMQSLCFSKINATADNPVAEALQATTRFVAILKSLSHSKCNQAFGTRSFLDLCVSSNHGSNARDDVTSLGGTPAPSPFCAATYLLLLSSYIQIVHLFNAMFRRMAEVLGDMTEEAISKFQPQPDFRVAGLPTMPSRLYLKILMQIIDDQIESIECLMGISAECCLSGRAPARKGIFSDQDVSALLENIMGQGNGSSSASSAFQGKLIVVSLRESIATVKELLRG